MLKKLKLEDFVIHGENQYHKMLYCRTVYGDYELLIKKAKWEAWPYKACFEGSMFGYSQKTTRRAMVLINAHYRKVQRLEYIKSQTQLFLFWNERKVINNLYQQDFAPLRYCHKLEDEPTIDVYVGHKDNGLTIKPNDFICTRMLVPLKWCYLAQRIVFDKERNDIYKTDLWRKQIDNNDPEKANYSELLDLLKVHGQRPEPRTGDLLDLSVLRH